MLALCRTKLGGVALLGLIAIGPLGAQEPPAASGSGEPAQRHVSDAAGISRKSGMRQLRKIAEDQRGIWTSPARIRTADTKWLVPFGGITAGLLFTDQAATKNLSRDPQTVARYNRLSAAGVAALVGAAGGLSLWGMKSHDERKRETGFLAGESALNSFLVVEAMKFSMGRQRPNQGNGSGHFLNGGQSSPSEHAAAAFAIAGILAHEYPGPLTKFLAYGLATAVSVSRVRARQHFPSDVVLGGAIGWLVSERIYRQRHNPELGGGIWGAAGERGDEEVSPSASRLGSSYVPLDSWVYPALERFAALGYINTSFQGMKPWTRTECARLLEEAVEALAESPAADSLLETQARELQAMLAREFRPESSLALGSGNRTLILESVYARATSISGPPLTDGFHFGQTIAYDFGRPFREGMNLLSGASARASWGPLFLYFRGEFQHSPSAPPLSGAVRQVIAERDNVPVPIARPFGAINRFALLDTYVGVNLSGWQVTFGKQSLSWGPGPGGSLLLSNNADPIGMLRIAPVHPVELPSVFRFFGPIRTEMFVGRLEGHVFSVKPWIYGQKFSFKPLRSLEFAYSRTTLIGGSGHPLNAGRVFRSVFGRVDPQLGTVPGDSHTAVDWTWRLPGLRDRVVFYGELEADDDLIPFQNLPKAVLRPGVYLTRLPFLPKWDAHVEWTTSDSPGRASFQGHGDLNYWNFEYRDGYRNNGTLLGNTVGREGQTLQVWTRYWISPRHEFDFTWKRSQVRNDFIPGGGNWQDVQAGHTVALHSGLTLKTLVQYEHIGSFPLLFAGSRNNLTASFEIGFEPQRIFRFSSAVRTAENSAAGSGSQP